MRGYGNKCVDDGGERVQVLFGLQVRVCEVDGVEDEKAGGVGRQAADDKLFAAGYTGALGVKA